MPSLVQLRYALAVEEHRHFGKASQICHVTQPTLSQALAKLEDEVGLVLFDRLKKPILPTPEGAAFLRQARVVVREEEKLLHLAEQVRSGAVSGEFRLGVIPTVASDLLPRIVEPFLAAYPKVRLSIEELKTEVIVDALTRDKLDGAVLATPLDGADVVTRPLYYEPFCLYLSAGHPLLNKAAITKDDLDMNDMWLLQDGHCFKNQVLDFCGVARATTLGRGGIDFQSGSLATLRRLIQHGRGYTLIPALMAHAMDKDEQAAHVRAFKAPAPVREISVVHRRAHWKRAILDALETIIKAHVPKALLTSDPAVYVVPVRDAV